MTDIVDRARALLEGVTPEPWTWTHGMDARAMVLGPNDLVVKLEGYADARFIAAARSLVPELIAEVERLEAVVQRVRGLHASQGGGTPTGEYADICRECPSYHPCATLAALDGCCCHHQPITALPAATCDPCKLGRHIECERR